MVKTVVRYTFWHWFGLVTAFMMLIGLSLIIYNYIENNRAVKLKAEAEVYKFNPPPFIGFELDDDQKTEMIEKIRQNIPIKEPSTEQAKSIFDKCFHNHVKSYADYLKKFPTYYQIKLSNQSEISLTEISVELKGKGFYLYDGENADIVYSNFKNTINIPEIMSNQSALLLIWSENIFSNYQVFPAKAIEISCKEGNTDIRYPVKVSGIMAWNVIHNNYPLIFIISGVLVLFVVLIVIFFNMGIRQQIHEQEKND